MRTEQINQLFACLLFFVCLSGPGLQQAHAQQKYWVFLTDKKGSTLDPYRYFDAKAIERRVSQNLPLYDYSDLPLNCSYTSKIAGMVDSVKWESRWFNAVSCYATPAQVDQLRKLPFVKDIEAIQSKVLLAAAKVSDDELSNSDKELMAAQVQTLGIQEFREKGIDGKGIRIAVFDAGFTHGDKSPVLKHLHEQKRILKTYDFIEKSDFVYDHSTHGSQVLSCIAGIYNDQPLGLATGAEFILARTEYHGREPFSEEENWLAAVEWADKNGADIINSSLGYIDNRYFQEQMDGKTSLVARAANMAARKGMLVVNAAGNEGSAKWKKINTPADADSVLAVGGISHTTGYHINFSSYGPTADFRLKPNVSAYGWVMVASKDGVKSATGTSFSSPLVAGFAACAWQYNRNLSNMELFKEIEKAGNLYPYFDYAHGYGVPQAAHFTATPLSDTQPTFELIDKGTTLSVMVTDMDFKADSVQVMEEVSEDEEDAENEEQTKKEYLYYHIQNQRGYLDKYFVVEVEQPEVLILNKEEIGPGKTIRITYHNYTKTYSIN